MMKNPRKLKRNIIDGLCSRIIDPIKMLESRTYQESEKITINISGQNQDDIEGTYSIETDGKNTEVKKTNSNPDISMRPSELSSIYFGSVRASEFYQAGLFDIKNHDILRKINKMFSVEQSPWCNTDF